MKTNEKSQVEVLNTLPGLSFLDRIMISPIVLALVVVSIGFGPVHCSAASQDIGESLTRHKEQITFRPPAVPLVTVDPYMSVWSLSDNLHESWPVHWTGQVHAMAGMVRVDGRTYRFMGTEVICPDTAKQISLDVKPTTTIYTFEAGNIELKVSFMTPMLASDLSLLTSPVTFLTFGTRTLDGRSHAVTIYFDITGEWVVNKPSQETVWRRMPGKIADMKFISMGSAEQPILEREGDNVRIDWGYLYVGAPAGDTSRIVVTSHEARKRFVETVTVPRVDDTRMPRSADDDWPVIACTIKLDTSDSKPVRQTMVLAYDDIFSIDYMGQKLRPWYYRVHGDFVSMLGTIVDQYPAIRRKCGLFDNELLDDARQIGAEAYKHLISISYRHTWASGKVVVSPDGSQPWFFHKECFFNGCMTTVDVSYPASPFFALFSPTLLNGMIAPVFEYAASEQWPYGFAPHDVGRYPKGNGQVYGRDLKIQNTYGLPLDNRADFTKSDWLVWSATLATNEGDFEKLIYQLYRFTNESPDRVPFSDWYFTSTAKVRGFRARPVIGGAFIPFLKGRVGWQKWVSLADVHR